MLLRDKVAVIYGAGAVGSSTARVFAREGARVFLAGRTLTRLEALVSDIKAAGGWAAAAQVDALDQEAVAAHAADIARQAGGIDIALNAVSFIHDQGSELETLSLEAFMRPIDRFMCSLFITTKAVVPHMGGARAGVILTLSTPGARMAAGGHLGYSAACAATEAFSRVLADELGPKNIRVVCLRPHAIGDAPAAGSYTRELFEPKAAAMGLSVEQWLDDAAQGTMLNRLPKLSEVAETAAFLASDRASAMTATIANLTCGALAD